MWGNARGWIISAVLVGLFGWVVFYFESAKAVSAPTAFGRDPANLAALRLPVDPETVVAMDAAGDAGPLYREAIAAYRADALAYDRLAGTASGRADPTAGPLAAFGPLVAAMPMASMDLFRSDPAKVVGYDADPPDLAALRQVGLAASRAALLSLQSDPAESRRLFEAVFSLGAKLFDERVAYSELQAGLELMSTGAAGLTAWAQRHNDDDLAIRAKLFDDARRGYAEQRIAPAWRIVSSIDLRVQARHAGDVFALAERSAEPLWRTESLLKLGRYKFAAARLGDKAGASRVARRVAADESADPAARLAAERARDLTLLDYRRLK